MESLKNLIATLGVKRLAIMGGTAAVLIAGLIFLSVRASRPDMGLLFTDLEPAQAQAITEKLRGMNVPFQITPDGAGIMAPVGKLPELRMSLAAEQISGPIGYELLDQQDALGTTAFLQNINHVRAIEGELARSISSLSAVQRARVHLSIPQRALFEREQRPPSAAITLKTRTRLSSGQVTAIRDMVAAAVPGLEPGRISIVDQSGTLLARSGTDDATGLATTMEERRTGIEGRMRQDVETMLERIVGTGKVRVEVAAELDLDTVRLESEVYDPDAQVVARSTTVESGQQSNDSDASGPVGVANNLPEAEAQGAMPGTTSTTSSTESSEQVEYQNSRTRTTTMRNAGSIKRLTVAVMVDGNYAGTGEDATYQPRSPEELAQFRRLVQNAIGFNEERGDSVVVENLRFAQTDDPFADEGMRLPLGLEADNLTSLAEIAIIGVLGVLGFFFIIRPMLRSMRDATVRSDAALAMDPQLPSPEQRLALAPPEGIQVPQELIERAAAGEEEAIRLLQSMRGNETGLTVETEIDVAQIEGRLKTSALKKVGDVIERNPNEAVAIIRQWMNT